MSGVKGMRDKLFKSPVMVDKFRASIRVALIRNRLMKHFLGELEMSATQIRAAEILISKAIPSLANVEHTGADGGPIQVTRLYYDDAALQLPSSSLPAADSEGAGLRH
jgi:hypothetical protein